MISVQVGEQCSIIWQDYMGCQADHPVNVDSKSYKITQENMNNPDRSELRVVLTSTLILSASGGPLTSPVPTCSI